MSSPRDARDEGWDEAVLVWNGVRARIPRTSRRPSPISADRHLRSGRDTDGQRMPAPVGEQEGNQTTPRRPEIDQP